MRKNNVKKSMLIAMLLLVTTCSFGCAKEEKEAETGKETETEKSNGIELTLENYEDYLNVTTQVTHTGQGYKLTGLADPYYKQIASTLNVEGVSSNYNYEDVEVEAIITVVYTPIRSSGNFGREVTFDETLKAECNVAGDGSETIITDTQYVRNIFATYSCEITSVSGVVVPVK